MGKENGVSRNTIPLIHGLPMTRALASSEVAVATQNQGRVLRANGKRRALDEKKGNARKKRAVLKDITNLTCENSYRSCFNVPKIQNTNQIKKGRGASSKGASSSAASQGKEAKVEVVSNSAGGSFSGCIRTNQADCSFTVMQSSRLPIRPRRRSSTVKRSCVGRSSIVESSLKFVDIDSDVKDLLLCSLYAPDIYYNLHVDELKRRPLPDFMERTQRDWTQTMRAILIDWLVEVAEEYTLVSDTLYLAVYLIDWFLQGNNVERHRLQLLGITCMLVASKYEEISAPRIEEFCFITDNAYTKDQVLEMESQVLKHFNFQIYTPTSKTFLRRFIRAAQASHLDLSLEMEFLANFLTELTLLEYEFLKFLPSIIAASAVFLAKWTLNQSTHPWNPTLEHYTTYKASDLKTSVPALQDLQLNTKDSPLNSIRVKYRQEKFKSVSLLTSPKLPDKLFD